MNIVCFGGGTNSTAMIIGMYLHEIPVDLILFADTGAEQPHTYDFMERFNDWLLAHGLPQITVVWRTDKDGNRLFLEEDCLNYKRLPSIAYGFKGCSGKFKTGVQEKFCNNYPPCVSAWSNGEKIHKYVGYDAEKPDEFNMQPLPMKSTKSIKITTRFIHGGGIGQSVCGSLIGRDFQYPESQAASSARA